MKYNQFVNQVQNRAQISSRGETEVAIKATLETLAERIVGDEASNLAEQLPEEIGKYLRGREGEKGHSFSLQEFYDRVSKKEHVEPYTAAHHVLVVMAVANEAATSGEFDDICANLSDDYKPIFAAESAN